jgi:hypothetical protein
MRTAGRRDLQVCLAGVGIALFALASLAGCERKNYQPLREDSTHVAVPDSFATLARSAVELWDQADGEVAARATALAVLADLRARAPREGSAAWRARAEAVLDSLSLGGETAEASCALIINFFSRANPDQGSWPWVYWCGEQAIEAQAVEGKGLKLQDLAARGLPTDSTHRSAGIAALYARRGAAGQQPVLIAWNRPPRGGFWQMQQTLGPDSLGGFGSGSFEPADTTYDLVARTYHPTPRFDECATCPHVFRIHRFHWTDAGFVRSEELIVPSPYSTFVQFATAMALSDWDMADRLSTESKVVDDARRLEIGAIKGLWRAAPSTDETAHQMVFMRGKVEAYRLTFEQRGENWLISDITPTSAAIE